MALVTKHSSAGVRRTGLKNTRQRRSILHVLEGTRKPLTPQEIHDALPQEEAVNLVTVYRILEKFAEEGIIHRHPQTKGYLLCTIPETEGHHGFLRCRQCGRVDEFVDRTLCQRENAIARKAGYEPISHESEILGLCPTCHATS